MSKKSYEWSSTSLLLLLGLLAALGLFLYWKKKQKEKQSQEEELDEESENMDHPEEQLIVDNYKIILNTLVENGINNEPFILIAAAQAMHETGYFTSNVFKNNKNYFGMRQPSVRDTTSLGDKGGYASFATLPDSVTDYVLWWRYKDQPPQYEIANLDSVKDFVKKLKAKGYYEDSVINYQNGVNKALNTLKSLISAG